MKISDYVLGLSSSEKRSLFKEELFRKQILNNDNHYNFTAIIQEVFDDSILDLFDDSFINDLLNSSRLIDKLSVLMSCVNSNKNLILSNFKLIDYVLSNQHLIPYIDLLNYEFGQGIIDYSIYINDSKYLYLIGNLSEEQQEYLLDYENILKIVGIKDLNYDFYAYLSKNCVSKFLSNKSFFDSFLDLDVEKINNLVVNGLVMPGFLINSQKIIKKYVKVSDSNKYREYINNLYIKNEFMVDCIEKERRKYVKKLISGVNDEGVFSEYEDAINDFDLIPKYDIEIQGYLYNMDYERLREVTSKNIFEMVIDCNFKDFAFNFFTNLKNILEYNLVNMCKIIPYDRLCLYKKIVNYENIDFKEKKDFMNLFDDNINYCEKFYEDFYNCRMHSYKTIVDSLVNLKEDNHLYSQDLSTKYGISIYELNGEEFYSLVHNTSVRKNCYKDIEIKDLPTISCALIGDKNVCVHGSYDSVFFGYFNFNYKNIMHVCNTDSFSCGLESSNKVQFIGTPESLIDESIGNNEILISEVNDKLIPDYIVCFNDITEYDVMLANDMSIPILKINTKCYEAKSGFECYGRNYYFDYKQCSKVKKYI